MQQDPRLILLKVLAIIDYKGNKEELVDKFLILIQEHAIATIINGLSTNQRDRLIEDLSSVKNSDIKNQNRLINILNKYVNSELYEPALKESAMTVFKDYLLSLEKILNDTQKDNLQKYFNTLN